MHIQTHVWPVVISEGWERDSDAEKLSEESDAAMELRVTARLRKAYLKDDKTNTTL